VGDEWSRQDGPTDHEFQELSAERREALEHLRQLLARGQLDKVRPALEVFLRLVNLELVADDATMRGILYGFFQTVTEITGDQVRRDQGDVILTYEQSFCARIRWSAPRMR
jgi:hypothetical protein